MTTPRATPAGGPVGAQVSSSAAAPVRPAGATPAGPVGSNGGSVSVPSASSDRGTSTAGPRRVKGQRRPPRLASLQLKRIDPWTVLKISLIVAIVMFFVWMIAIGVLYLSLGSLDVWSKINTTYATLVTSADTTGGASNELITPSGVFIVAAVIGAINIVLFTALATVAAFVYNAAAGMSGGVEITLGERD